MMIFQYIFFFVPSPLMKFAGALFQWMKCIRHPDIYCNFMRILAPRHVKAAEGDWSLTAAVVHIQVVMEGKFKKKIEAKTDALLSEVSRKTMPIEWQ